MVPGGHRSSVIEHWQLKTEALGSTPGGTAFLLCPLLFQRSMDSNGPDCVFPLDKVIVGLWTIEKSHQSDSSTAVIMLVIFHTSTTHTAINSAPHKSRLVAKEIVPIYSKTLVHHKESVELYFGTYEVLMLHLLPKYVLFLARVCASMSDLKWSGV